MHPHLQMRTEAGRGEIRPVCYKTPLFHITGVREHVELNVNLWFSCLLVLDSHCKKHSANSALYSAELAAYVQNTHLHTQSPSIHLRSLRVSWATASTGAATSPPISGPCFRHFTIARKLPPPNAHSPSKSQVFIRAKWSIYCHIYVFPSYLPGINYHLIDSYLFFKCFIDEFSCAMSPASCSQKLYGFYCWFYKAQWF